MNLERVEIIKIHNVKIKASTVTNFADVDITIKFRGKIQRVEMAFDLSEWIDIKEQMYFMYKEID